MATKKKILYIVEAMGGGVFTYIVDLANELVDTYDMYIAYADVFLLPSRWEGLPISLLESMYMKKICVVSNVIGNRDVIHNGENGLVCSTAEEFADAIKTTEDSNNVAMSIDALIKAQVNQSAHPP